MAKEMQTPVEIVSMPYRAQISLAFIRASTLSMPQLEPKAASVSYSGPPYRMSTGSGPSSFTARLHRMGQAKQVSRFFTYPFSNMYWGLIRATSGKLPPWKFRIGRLPMLS